MRSILYGIVFVVGFSTCFNSFASPGLASAPGQVNQAVTQPAAIHSDEEKKECKTPPESGTSARRSSALAQMRYLGTKFSLRLEYQKSIHFRFLSFKSDSPVSGLKQVFSDFLDLGSELSILTEATRFELDSENPAFNSTETPRFLNTASVSRWEELTQNGSALKQRLDESKTSLELEQNELGSTWFKSSEERSRSKEIRQKIDYYSGVILLLDEYSVLFDELKTDLARFQEAYRVFNGEIRDFSLPAASVSSIQPSVIQNGFHELQKSMESFEKNIKNRSFAADELSQQVRALEAKISQVGYHVSKVEDQIKFYEMFGSLQEFVNKKNTLAREGFRTSRR